MWRNHKFRKKGVCDRFTLANDRFSVEGSHIRIPNLGWVGMRDTLRFTGKIMSGTIHQLTTSLTRRFHTVGIEDLNVKGMVKNQNLARCVADMGFFEFRRQLEYKEQMRGGTVVVADR